jgi:glucokinase
VVSEPVVLGVDVGGTKVEVGAVCGSEVSRAVERPTELESTEALLDGLEATAQELIADVGRPAAVGAGVPSQIEFATGRVMSSVNIPLEGVALRDELERRFGLPAFVDNDGNCAALAEAELRGVRDLVMLTLGTGVGGGVVIGGRIFRGTHGLGAELGHVTIEKDGPPCPGNCPNRGCLEALASGTALERDATETGKDHPDSALGSVYAEHGRVHGHDAVEAARAGDRLARRLFARLAEALGVGIASFVNVFEPEQLVIGGGLSEAADLFLEDAVVEAGVRALPVLWERVTVSVAQSGADAGVIGAGLLARHELRGTSDTPEKAREGAT